MRMTKIPFVGGNFSASDLVVSSSCCSPPTLPVGHPRSLCHLQLMLPHIIAALLDTDSQSSDKEEASNTTSLLTKEEEAMTEKYRKMLKMSIPPEAVRHSMSNDGTSLSQCLVYRIKKLRR